MHPSPVKSVEKKAATDASVSKKAEVEPMQVDTAIESSQSEASKPETSKPAEVVPPSKLIADLLPAPIVSVECAPTKIIEQPIVLESSGVSAAADTTTAIVIDEPSQNNANDGQPIELHSSPSDDDSKGPTVTNSQKATINQPDAIVELESSSNEGDTKDELVVKTHEIDSLDLELINSDSSHSANDVQIAEIPASKAVQEKSVPTSTVEPDTNDVTEVTEIIDEPINNINTNNNNADESVHTSGVQQNSVPSTNNQPIEIPDKLCTTITGKLIDETNESF